MRARLVLIILALGAGGLGACSEPRNLPAVTPGTDDGSATGQDTTAPDTAAEHAPADSAAGADGPSADTTEQQKPDGPAADTPPPADVDVPDAAADGPAPADARPQADLGPDTSADAPIDSAAAKLATGQPCQPGDACASGHCVDGFCCATLCDGKCSACAQAQTGQPNGACAPALAGQDPHATCDKSAQTCGEDGTCDGKGECRFAAATVNCGAETCLSGTYTAPAFCDGKGACAKAQTMPCGIYPCVGNHCAVSCSQAAPCGGGFYCDTGAKCAPKKGPGDACNLTEECTSGNCVEQVCCDTACGGKCQSCVAVNTGVADGQCAPVKAGLDPFNHCAASDPSTCRQDGFCDGGGNCRLHRQGTVCRAEQCVDGANTSTHLAQGTCNGTGLCSDPGTGDSCKSYVCTSSTSDCRKSCTQQSHCVTGSYCAPDSMCQPKKPLGAFCGVAAECTSGICGFRCCAQACQCPQPGSGNLLKNVNAAFDANYDSWDRSPLAAAQFDHSMDGTDCWSYSGSLQLTVTASGTVPWGDGTSADFFQCVPVTPGVTYHFGGKVRGDTDPVQNDWGVSCEIVFFGSLSACWANDYNDGSRLLQVIVTPAVKDANVWYDFDTTGTAPTSPTAATYARYRCSANSDGPVSHVNYDMMYVSTDGKY